MNISKFHGEIIKYADIIPLYPTLKESCSNLNQVLEVINTVSSSPEISGFSSPYRYGPMV